MAILAVDDSPPILRLLESTLHRSGYADIICADSGVKALELLGIGENPDSEMNGINLVLLDIVMPEIDGMNVCRQIKKNKKTRDIPVIMITVRDEAETLKDAFEAGASDYIVKPVRELELLARVNAVLKLKREKEQRLARERDLLEMAAKLEDANKRLEKLNVTDDVTGVGNRRAFVQNLKQEWGRCLRESWPLTVIMVEIDFFREYQEQFGLQKSDICLKLVANVLQVALKRSGDYLARFEAEIFAVFLPKTDLAGAKNVADAMRASVEALQVSHPQSPQGEYVSVTVGVGCMVPTVHSRYDELIGMAETSITEQRPRSNAG